MKYFFKNGDYAGSGVKDCKVVICEGQQPVSFAKEWRTVGKKLEFLHYDIDKQERLLCKAVEYCTTVPKEEKEIFLRVLSKTCGIRKNLLNAKEVRGYEQ